MLVETNIVRSKHHKRAISLCPKQVVVATDQGDLYLFETLEFRCALATPTAEAICILGAFTKGFVAGGANGVLRVFERSDDPGEFFKCLKVTMVL